MDDTLVLLALIILAVVIMFVLPQFSLRRAITAVIQIFRQQNAVGAKNAKTPETLGFQPRTFTQSLFRGRNYKFDALQILRSANIIQTTEDGKLYLSEEDLAASKFSKYDKREARWS